MARHEYVSSLYVYDLKEGRSDLFFKNLASCECVIAEGRKASIYSGMGQDLDIRSKNWFETPAGSATEYVNKYMRGTQIPLLKLSEMYLIAAEASGDIRYLDTPSQTIILVFKMTDTGSHHRHTVLVAISKG